jgi:hypothetical protein
MNFSRDDFDRNVTALLSAFALSGKECEPGLPMNGEPFVLCDWRLSHDTNGYNSSYLSHPPVTVLSGMSSIADEEAHDIIFTTRESEGNLEDDEILVDDQCYMTTTTTNEKGELQQQYVAQWTFSIIYSTTYQAPVLYFHVQELNGNPVGRQQVLNILRQEHQRSAFEFSNDFPTDAWEFVSQEEHPVTGLSSFFLHPCQSAQRLQLLTTVVGDQREVCIKLEQKSSVLWAWMSMVLPAVGHSIPSSYFRYVQKCIAQQP